MYNTSRIIILPIVEKIKYQIDQNKRELNSSSIINKYKHLNRVIENYTIVMLLSNGAFIHNCKI